MLMGIREQLEAGLRPGLEMPEALRGMPEDWETALVRVLGALRRLGGGSTGDTDLQGGS